MIDVNSRNKLEQIKRDIELSQKQNINIVRGGIYYANVDGNIGSEQGGIRPVVVIQNQVGNVHSPTTIVAMLTSQQSKAKLPTHVEIKGCGLEKDSVVLLEQVRTLDKIRIISFVGNVDELTMKKIDKARDISMGELKRKQPIDYLSKWAKKEIMTALENVYLYEDALRNARQDNISFRTVCLKEIEMYMNDFKYLCDKNKINYKELYKDYKARDMELQATM